MYVIVKCTWEYDGYRMNSTEAADITLGVYHSKKRAEEECSAQNTVLYERYKAETEQTHNLLLLADEQEYQEGVVLYNAGLRKSHPYKRVRKLEVLSKEDYFGGHDERDCYFVEEIELKDQA